ncbi:MAG: 3'(2'),5'-bisphosphate nucleotidase CysQ [Bdellovibrionales bacterium]|nr:3'(2'),5'-bisphosphate nucleotidase CysQ [Bdellovibrionales bacterium]
MQRQQVEDIAREAGKKIWEMYQGTPLEVETKADDSPVTQADLEANRIITLGLEKLGTTPILSEEALPDSKERLGWSEYWLVDPLDGTKGFIKRTGDFTVNIALIRNQKPVMGVIYVPKTEEMYSAELGSGAFKDGETMSNKRQGPPTVAVASKLHQGEEADWMNRIGIEDTVNVNSSLKLCWLAEGKADIYPRNKPTMEWDTGAGEIILTEAACQILSLPRLEAMPHNQEDLTNPGFIAFRSNLNFEASSDSIWPTLK